MNGPKDVADPRVTHADMERMYENRVRARLDPNTGAIITEPIRKAGHVQGGACDNSTVPSANSLPKEVADPPAMTSMPMEGTAQERQAKAGTDRTAEMGASSSARAGTARTAEGGAPQSPAMHTVCLATVEVETVEWIWSGRIPLAKLTMLDGDPGLGKSTLTIDLAARVSTGAPMPEESEPREPAGVVLLSAEDGLADTIRPRLEAAGADLRRVHAVSAVVDGKRGERAARIPKDIDELRKAIRRVGARLLVIDPVMAFLGGDANSDQEVRQGLHPLVEVAQTERVAVVLVRHLNKRGTGAAIYRGGGSIGLIGAARSGLLVARDPQDRDSRVLAITKCNLAKEAPAIRWRLVPTGCGVAAVEWGPACELTADDLLSQPEDAEERAKLADAEDFLRYTLRGGPVDQTEIEADAKAAMIAKMTLRRAKARLGIRSRRTAFTGPWRWYFPAIEISDRGGEEVKDR